MSNKKMNHNQDRNKPKISEEKLKELGIIKVIGISISDNEEATYRCVDENGSIVFLPVSAFDSE